MQRDDLQVGRRYRVTFAEPRCAGVRADFTAAFLGWRPDPADATARWRDRAVFANGVAIGPRPGGWRAEPAPTCTCEPATIC